MKYFVLFDYYEVGSGDFGTLKDEHFWALESFWNDVVRNEGVVHGSIGVDAVFVLPRNYGWGMRRSEDRVWGIFEPDNTTYELWDLMQVALEVHGPKLDFVYDDEFFSANEYQQFYRLDPDW